MDRELLDTIEFKTKAVKLPKPVKKPLQPKARSLRSDALMRLMIFILIIVAVIFGGKLAIEYTVSFCRGESHQDIGTIIDGISEMR